MYISHICWITKAILRVTQLILMLLPPRFMPELLPRRMRELSIDHARKSSRVDFLDECAKYARILREFCANFVGLCVDLNPFRAFPRITRERERIELSRRLYCKWPEIAKGHNSNISFNWFKIYSGDLLLNPNQYTKYHGSSLNTFWDILLKKLKCLELQRAITTSIFHGIP